VWQCHLNKYVFNNNNNNINVWKYSVYNWITMLCCRCQIGLAQCIKIEDTWVCYFHKFVSWNCVENMPGSLLQKRNQLLRMHVPTVCWMVAIYPAVSQIWITSIFEHAVIPACVQFILLSFCDTNRLVEVSQETWLVCSFAYWKVRWKHETKIKMCGLWGSTLWLSQPWSQQLLLPYHTSSSSLLSLS